MATIPSTLVKNVNINGVTASVRFMPKKRTQVVVCTTKLFADRPITVSEAAKKGFQATVPGVDMIFTAATPAKAFAKAVGWTWNL